MRWFVLILVALLPAGCSKAKERQQAAEDKRNTDEAKARLKTVGLAMHSANDVYGGIPAGISTPGGRTGLSWRVQILPFLGEDALYKQFKLAEPWDSEHNKALAAKMPEVYATPGGTAPAGHTHLRSFVAVGGKFKAFMPSAAEIGTKFANRDPQPGRTIPGRPLTSFANMDGSSNVLMVAEAAESVVWTKPDDLEYDAAQPPPKLGVFPGGFLGLMGDANVCLFPETLPEAALRQLITVDDGAVLPPDVDAILKAASGGPNTAPPVTK